MQPAVTGEGRQTSPTLSDGLTNRAQARTPQPVEGVSLDRLSQRNARSHILSDEINQRVARGLGVGSLAIALGVGRRGLRQQRQVRDEAAIDGKLCCNESAPSMPRESQRTSADRSTESFH